jgi:hypothetical protein
MESERGVNSPQLLILAASERHKARNPPGEEDSLLGEFILNAVKEGLRFPSPPARDKLTRFSS